MIKVAAIGVFIVLGVLAIFGLLPGTHSVGASNLTGHGGFFPHGYGAVVTGLLTVVFAFMGSEIVTIAAGESRDPGRAVTKAVNSVIWRILVFYLGSIAVVITLLPWNAGNVMTSPYVAVIFNYTSPETVFLFLLNGSGAVALVVWALIAVSQLRMRRCLEREAPERILVRMWLYPYLTIATILGIAAILVVAVRPRRPSAGPVVDGGRGGRAHRRVRTPRPLPRHRAGHGRYALTGHLSTSQTVRCPVV
jgi:L-asparagine transporter-like permease